MAHSSSILARARALQVIEHRQAQARSDAKRKARNAPKRDDINRAAYYVLLLAIREDEMDGSESQLRHRLLRLLAKAGFDEAATKPIVTRHANRAVREMEGWIHMRRPAQEPSDPSSSQSAAEQE